MAKAQEDFQRLAGQALLALDRLVGIGVDAQANRLRYVAGLAQLLLQALGQIGLDDQPGLEVDARRHVPVGMAGPGETIDAAMLAAAIGIHRTVEADVRRLVASNYRPGSLGPPLGGATGRRLLLEPAVVLGLAAGRGEAV